jgi:(1->4)-alpha-D-glucan 1-alpha-D-glucosylmutase
VDYAFRKKIISQEEKPANLIQSLADGRAKLHVIREGLRVRRKFPHLFHGARYTPLHADGGMEEKICAFSLSDGKDTVIAVAPRLFAGLMKEGDLVPAWGDSRLTLPDGRYTNELTSKSVAGGPQRLADLLAELPVALLTATL